MIDCIVRLFQRYIFTDTDRKAKFCTCALLSQALLLFFIIKWLFVNHAANVRNFLRF